MRIVRWSRERWLAADPGALDELDGVDLLVLDDVTGDDVAGWLTRAPCVVAGLDVEVADDELELVAGAVAANRRAARALVDVLRTVEHLDVERGLVVESLAYSMLLGGPEFAAWLAAQPERGRDRSFACGPVRADRDGDTLRIALSRPEHRNAFGLAVRDALVEALIVAEVDASIDRVVLTGDGPGFCSGGDLTEFGSASDLARAHQVRTLRSAGAAIARIATRVTVEVHGACVGAGVELPAFAGHVVARPDTTFRLPEVGMGLVPGAGGTVSLTKRIGRQRTARLALLGTAINVTTAREWGLVDEVTST